MSSGPAEWREDDHRNAAIGPPRVLGEVREALGPPSELPLALLAGCLPGQDVDRLAPHLDSGVRLCLEVVVTSRRCGAAAAAACHPRYRRRALRCRGTRRSPVRCTRL